MRIQSTENHSLKNIQENGSQETNQKVPKKADIVFKNAINPNTNEYDLELTNLGTVQHGGGPKQLGTNTCLYTCGNSCGNTCGGSCGDSCACNSYSCPCS